ncbi:MAG: GNAT family N-acetyltransferase [Gammaproteobacteria bacterium]
MNVEIRQATIADIDIVVDYNARLAEETENMRLDRERLRRGVTTILGDRSKGLYFLAEIGGKTVGQISVTFEWSDWRNGNFWWLQSVYIEEAYRGRGILKQLFNYLMALPEVNTSVRGLRLYVEKSNESASAAYRRLGFEPAHYDMMELGFKTN